MVRDLFDQPIFAGDQIGEDQTAIGAGGTAAMLHPIPVAPDVERELPARQARLLAFIPDLIAVAVQEFQDLQDRVAAVAEVGPPLRPRISGAAFAALADGGAVGPARLERLGQGVCAVVTDQAGEEGVALGVGGGGGLAGRGSGREVPARQVRLILFLYAVEVTIVAEIVQHSGAVRGKQVVYLLET